MSEQIIAVLKRKLDDLAGEMDAETRRNALKEVLHFYVLNFIYHHPKYNKWIMYGGSALRVNHGLDRMSVDLDFEISHAITGEFLNKLKKEIGDHFFRTYDARPGFLDVKIVSGRGLLLKFDAGKELSLGHPSSRMHVKIDLNRFSVLKGVSERRPINQNQFSFVLETYNISTLMASKVAAIFLRGTRGVGKAFYGEKGRDIYDLLWYMNNKVVPNLGYLAAKKVKEAKDLRILFYNLTKKMNAVSDKNLKQDLMPLFVNRTYIENWLKNWKESYLQFCNEYKIRTIKRLENVKVHQDFGTENFLFTYIYNAEEEGKTFRIQYIIGYHWIEDREGDLSIEIDENIKRITKFKPDGWIIHPVPHDKLLRYVTLFNQKTKNYLKKTNRIMLGRSITTKLIRMTADNLNRKEQIVLNKPALLSCKLEELLK